MGRASSIGEWIAAHARWLIAATMLCAAMLLRAMGRSPICPCGTVRLWHGPVQSAENSQQLADWYSLGHVVHGLIFYGATWLVLRRWPWTARLVLATVVEAAWEVLENSPAIIARYRAVTVSWGYNGDSIVNSLSDILCMMLGFALARRLSLPAALLLAVALELTAAAVIRDNLTLNLLMLIAPSDAVRTWQAG